MDADAGDQRPRPGGPQGREPVATLARHPPDDRGHGRAKAVAGGHARADRQLRHGGALEWHRPRLPGPGRVRHDELTDAVGHLHAGASRGQPDEHPVAVPARVEALARQALHRPPADWTQRVDLGRRLTQAVEAARELMLVAVQDERLVEEGPQHEILARMAEPVAQEDRQAPGDLVGDLPADERPAPRRLGQPVALEPGVGPRHRDGLEAARHQADRRRLRQPLVRRRHDARNPQPGPALERGDAVQGVLGPARRRGLVPQPSQLRTVMRRPCTSSDRKRSWRWKTRQARGCANQPSSGVVAIATWYPCRSASPASWAKSTWPYVGQWRLGSSRMNEARSGGGDQRAAEQTPRRKCTSARRPRHRPGTSRWRSASWGPARAGPSRPVRTDRGRGPRARRRRGGPRAPPARSGAAARRRRPGRRSASHRRAVRRARPRAPAGRPLRGRRRPARRQRRRGTAGPVPAVHRPRPERARRAPPHPPAHVARSAPEARTRAPPAGAGARRTPPPERCRPPPGWLWPTRPRRRSAAAGGRRCAAGCRGAAACRSGRPVRPGCRAPWSAARPSA